MAKVLDKRVIDAALDVARERAEQGSLTTGGSPDVAARRFRTTRFGEIDVDPDLVIDLVEGMIGFESCHEFVVVRHDDRSAFRWLQSLDEPAIAFPIVEPVSVRPDYAPTISDSDARLLGLKQDTPTLLFVVVCVPGGDPKAMTANLLAPLVINGFTRMGKQVIVQDEGYGTRHLLVKELDRAARLGSAPVDVSPITAQQSGRKSAPARAA
ncbi:MAG TPA: flagellar assembly protein FliW [Chthonomonadaceae bacterium]|nr:flagellar assembly protein FliW [Chthonomonadaceae bacterium]